MNARLTLVCLAIGISTVAQTRDAADIVLLNGRVYTLDAARPWAEAVAVRDGRIMAVGTTAEMRAVAGAQTRTVDLAGAFVSPGFNDAHVHVDSTGSLLVGVNLLEVHEAKAFTEAIRGAAGRLPKGSWITRGDWGAYEQWAKGAQGAPAARPAPGAAGPFTPHRDLIDAVTPDHPVFVNRFDRSMFLANSLALKLAGITESTPNPPNGEIAKDAGGRPTGILRGAAADLVRKVIPPVPFEQRLVQVRAVLKEAREGGVTTIQDLTSAEQLRAYQELQRRGELTTRILLRPTLDNVVHARALGISRGFGDDWLRFIGYKAWVDGIMGSSGAMFFEPYDHDPKNKGLLRDIMNPEGQPGAAMNMTAAQRYTDFPPGNLEKLVEQAIASGIPPHIHAIGDKGNRIILDIYEKLLAKHGLTNADHRWRVIHAQVVHPDDFARFGRLKLVAEVNPYHVSDDMRWMEERIGRKRSEGAYAFRRLKDAGAVLIFGSDSPGTNAARYFLNPVYGLYAAVTRQTLTGEPKDGWFPDQRLTIEEAIEAYTKAPAWASFEEEKKGTITPGKLADLAVFDTNLVEVGRSAPARLLEARVLYTLAGGKVVFERTPGTHSAAASAAGASRTGLR
ncbi:MAG TPA: amidohydrolase [Vicinamibacterales bacterium]|nr:amidohydrolase [Vicinamibacterales bacterium]